MKWESTVLCLCVLAVSADDRRESKVVKTSQGAVRGYKDSEHGIFEFYSIPYATAPTGPDRFKAPLPPPVWSQPFEATDKGIICPQADFYIPFLPPDRKKVENCLITNVYIPDNDNKNLPVVVYVHGGAFQIGYGDMIVPKKYVSEHNIIVVNFNYRLGIHGFLCLGTEKAPGNAGMKDQVALLRWVKENIANFGGNPDDITLVGASAGSASVDLLMLSKAAEGLFTKVVPESGANTAVFSMQSDPLQIAKNFANALNFTRVDDVYALEQFYLTTPYDELIIDTFFDRTNSSFDFSPCVELPSKEAFLIESPVDILKKGNYKQVPLLYGFTRMEGLLRIGFFDLWKNEMNQKFSDFIPADLTFESEKQKEDVAKTIKEFYFGDKVISEETVLAYVEYFTDVIFAYPTLRSVKLHLKNGHDQIYLYEFSYVDENTPVVPHTNVRGADHCAQSYALTEPLLPIFGNTNFTQEFRKMAATMRQLWANFIKTGTPVPPGSELPTWSAVRELWSPHMSLGNEFRLSGSLLERRASFWDQIYEKYYRNPEPPLKHTGTNSEL